MKKTLHVGNDTVESQRSDKNEVVADEERRDVTDDEVERLRRRGRRGSSINRSGLSTTYKQNSHVNESVNSSLVDDNDCSEISKEHAVAQPIYVVETDESQQSHLTYSQVKSEVVSDMIEATLMDNQRNSVDDSKIDKEIRNELERRYSLVNQKEGNENDNSDQSLRTSLNGTNAMSNLLENNQTVSTDMKSVEIIQQKISLPEANADGMELNPEQEWRDNKENKEKIIERQASRSSQNMSFSSSRRTLRSGTQSQSRVLKHSDVEALFRYESMREKNGLPESMILSELAKSSEDIANQSAKQESKRGQSMPHASVQSFNDDLQAENKSTSPSTEGSATNLVDPLNLRDDLETFQSRQQTRELLGVNTCEHLQVKSRPHSGASIMSVETFDTSRGDSPEITTRSAMQSRESPYIMQNLSMESSPRSCKENDAIHGNGRNKGNESFVSLKSFSSNYGDGDVNGEVPLLSSAIPTTTHERNEPHDNQPSRLGNIGALESSTPANTTKVAVDDNSKRGVFAERDNMKPVIGDVHVGTTYRFMNEKRFDISKENLSTYVEDLRREENKRFQLKIQTMRHETTRNLETHQQKMLVKIHKFSEDNKPAALGTSTGNVESQMYHDRIVKLSGLNKFIERKRSERGACDSLLSPDQSSLDKFHKTLSAAIENCELSLMNCLDKDKCEEESNDLDKEPDRRKFSLQNTASSLLPYLEGNCHMLSEAQKVRMVEREVKRANARYSHLNSVLSKSLDYNGLAHSEYRSLLPKSSDQGTQYIPSSPLSPTSTKFSPNLRPGHRSVRSLHIHSLI